MIAVGEKADLSLSAIQDLRQRIEGRTAETHLYVVWMNYQDQFLNLEAFHRKVTVCEVDPYIKRITRKLLESKRTGRWQ